MYTHIWHVSLAHLFRSCFAIIVPGFGDLLSQDWGIDFPFWMKTFVPKILGAKIPKSQGRKIQKLRDNHSSAFGGICVPKFLELLSPMFFECVSLRSQEQKLPKLRDNNHQTQGQKWPKLRGNNYPNLRTLITQTWKNSKENVVGCHC